MVVSQAQINTSTETVKNFFSPLRSDIETIREQLKLIIPTVAVPASKGSITVENIFRSFGEHFMDDSFEDVSSIGKYTDIKATTSETNTDVLIELKDYSHKIPKAEIDKFWRDMERRDAKFGIFISMRSGIPKISTPLKIETSLNRTAVFVVNNELNWAGHLYAYYTIKKLCEFEGKKKGEVKQYDFGKVVTKLNTSLTEIRDDMKSIEEIQTIADQLKTKTSKELDRILDIAKFFKRRISEKIEDAFEEIQKVGEK